MEYFNTLGELLKTLPKEELVRLGENQGLVSPQKLKKAHLVKHLSEAIPSTFPEDLIYLTSEELKILSGEIQPAPDILDGEVRKEKNKFRDDDFSIPELMDDMEAGEPLDDFFDALDEVQEEMFFEKAEPLHYLINQGYVYYREDADNPFQVPSEIYELSIQKEKTQKVDYQRIQKYIFATLTLYGCCSYERLHFLFHHQNGSYISLEDLRDYVRRFAEKRQKFSANDHYFFDKVLDKKELDALIKSGQELYYFPTIEEINYYSTEQFRAPAMAKYNELRDLILHKTKIEELLTGELIGYEEATEEGGIDILMDYNHILEFITLSLKMGDDLNTFLEELGKTGFRFDSEKDLKDAQALYLEASENTRKWPLKGFLNAELSD